MCVAMGGEWLQYDGEVPARDQRGVRGGLLAQDVVCSTSTT